MKEFNIKLTDEGNVYINDKLCECAYPMDKESKEDDLNKRAILALTNEMGYEAIFLFEEMADRLDEMLDEIDDKEDISITEEELETKLLELLPYIDNEIIIFWLYQFLSSKNKICIEELTDDEIIAEIEETKGSIDNFRLINNKHAIIDCEDYIEFLQGILDKRK